MDLQLQSTPRVNLDLDENGEPKLSMSNLVRILRHDENWRHVLLTNSKAGLPHFVKPPPIEWDDFGVVSDLSVVRASAWIRDNYGLAFPAASVFDAMRIAAKKNLEALGEDKSV